MLLLRISYSPELPAFPLEGAGMRRTIPPERKARSALKRHATCTAVAGMRIAQIAPLADSVPRKQYAGTQRVVSYLTEELVALGHEVTLFSSADSVATAQPMVLERVRERAQQFDVLHFHLDGSHFPTFRSLARKTVTTLHAPLDLPELASLFNEFS